MPLRSFSPEGVDAASYATLDSSRVKANEAIYAYTNPRACVHPLVSRSRQRHAQIRLRLWSGRKGISSHDVALERRADQLGQAIGVEGDDRRQPGDVPAEHQSKELGG